MRKLLLITYHFPPSGAVAVYRMLGLVRHLPALGWQPVVVAPPRVPWEPEDAALLTQIPEGTPVERVPYPSGFTGKVLRRLAPEAHWLLKAYGPCTRMIRSHQPAAIITSSPPGCVNILGMRLSKRFGLPWIADFRDPWVVNRSPEEIRELGRLAACLERKAMKQACVLVANTPLNQTGWTAAFPEHAGKMVLIPNGFDPARFTQPIPASEPSKTLTVTHAGELYYGRDPRPLLDAMKGLQAIPDRPELQIDFIGRVTDGMIDLPDEIRARGLEACVKSLGQMPYAQAIDRLLRADILLLLQTPNVRTGVPAKLYEYLGAGRPILALTELDGDVAWVLRESKVHHRIAPPRDVERIKQALLELSHEIKEGRPPVPDPTALQQFTRERMAHRFAECLDRLAGNAPPC